MARKPPIKKNKKKAKPEMAKAQKSDDVPALGLLRKLTHSAKSRMNFEEQETSGGNHEESRRFSAQTHPSSISCDNGDLPEWFEDLTEDNVSAFKDLFDMLDAANTGTLNADSLYEGLKRVDSDITREEVETVLKKLDKDGNGEIDFDEFLFHMTQGELLEGLGGDDADKRKKGIFSRRQRLFYTAITQFSLKRSLGEDFRYITKRQPHVLSHYTAGLRLVGLTDRQLALQMKEMQENARNTDSPYAKPLQFVSPTTGRKMKTMHRPGQVTGIQLVSLHKIVIARRDQRHQKNIFGNKDFTSKYKLKTDLVNVTPPKRSTQDQPEVREELKNDSSAPEFSNRRFPGGLGRESIVTKLPGGDLINKIRRQIMNKKFKMSFGIKTTPFENIKEEKPKDAEPKWKKHCGWTIPKIEQVFVPLPVLKIKYPRQHRPTIDDLPNIREQARKAMDEFYHNMQKACVVHSLEHWEKLYADTIRPKKLLENFRIVYRAYSPHKEEEAFVVCPWMPGPRLYTRRRINPLNHQTTWSQKARCCSNLFINPPKTDSDMRCASSLN